MPRLIHRQVTTIQIVSVELTWADDDEARPAAPETATVVRKRRRMLPKIKDAQDDGPSKTDFIETDDKT
jgi:hypothetical protein